MGYNDNFISDYAIDKYESFLNDPQKLDYIYIVYSAKYNENVNIDGEIILFKESLDHYVSKMVSLNPNYINTTQYKNYLTYLEKMSTFSMESLTNPFIRNINVSNCRQLLGDEFVVKLNNTRKSKMTILSNIESKIKRGDELTQSELNTYCEYFAMLRRPSEKYTELINYIFNQLSTSPNLKCSNQVLDAILGYLPFEYPKDNGFNPSNVRYVLTDVRGGKIWNSPGVSSRNHVYMNRHLFKDTNFKSIDDAKNGTYLKRGSDFTFLMLVAYHEISHNYQTHMAKNQELNNEGLMSVVSRVLNKAYNDYGRNHDTDDIEIDATIKGWKVCRDFFNKHYNGIMKEELSKLCYVNSAGTANRKATAYKVTDDGRRIAKTTYDIILMNKAVKANPTFLKDYPMLNKLYTQDGELRNDVLAINNLWSLTNGMDYIKYVLNSGEWQKILPILNNTSKMNLLYITENVYNALRSDIIQYFDLKYNKEHNLTDQSKNKMNDVEAEKIFIRRFYKNYQEGIKFFGEIYKLGNSRINETIKWYVSALNEDFIKVYGEEYAEQFEQIKGHFR